MSRDGRRRHLVSGCSLGCGVGGAARIGSDYADASMRATRYYEALEVETAIVPDPRAGVDAALGALDDGVDLIVLPGGSPSSLLDVVSGPVRVRLLDLYAAGTAISGASAGAMVLCSRMARPDRGDVVDGIGLVDGLALPHWSITVDPRWTEPDVTLWGLPECGGVIIERGAVRAVGAGAASVNDGGGWQSIPR